MPHPTGRPPSMAPTPREREWRRILDRWKKSGLTCRAFCRREAIDENSFYHWKRELRLRDERRRVAPPSPRRSRKPRPSLHWPVESLPETEPDASVPAIAVGSERTPAAMRFHPVRLATTASSAFEIAFPDGRLLRVGADFDAAALTRLLPILEAPTLSRGGSPC